MGRIRTGIETEIHHLSRGIFLVILILVLIALIEIVLSKSDDRTVISVFAGVSVAVAVAAVALASHALRVSTAHLEEERTGRLDRVMQASTAMIEAARANDDLAYRAARARVNAALASETRLREEMPVLWAWLDAPLEGALEQAPAVLEELEKAASQWRKAI